MLLVSKIPIEHFLAYKEDYVECLKFNINNNNISKIIIFVELIHPELPKSSKVEYLLRRGITEQSMFDTALKFSTENRIIMTNEISIFFNDNLSKISSEKTVYKNEYYTILNRETKFNNDFKKSTDLPIVYKINSLSDKIITQIEQVVVRKKGEVVKSKLRGVSSKLDVIIISVNYNDFLLVSLTHNTKIFDNITVVTSSDDLMCQKICERFDIKCIVTDCMYDNGSTFNKGKAINVGIDSITDPGFVLLLDADIVVSEEIKTSELDVETLYTSDRLICNTYEDYNSLMTDCDNWKRYSQFEADKGLGFFHLFHYSKQNTFPETSDNASFSDLLFRDKFTKRSKINNKIIHLGRAYKNWNGRVTDRFLNDEEFYKLTYLIKHNTSKISKYENIIKKNVRLISNTDYNFKKGGIYNPDYLNSEGKKYIVARCEKNFDSYNGIFENYWSSLVSPMYFEIDENFKIKSHGVFKMENFPIMVRYEDFRIFELNNKFYTNHNITLPNSQYRNEETWPNMHISSKPGVIVSVGISEIDIDNAIIRNIDIVDIGGKLEKNWSFFTIDDELYFIYSLDPYIVYKKIGEKFVKIIDKKFDYHWNVEPDSQMKYCISTNLKKIDDENFILFFHSKTFGYKYVQGCMIINKELLPIYMSKNPILESEEMVGKYPKVLYVFSVEVKEKEIHVYYGEADTNSCLAIIDKNCLLDNIMNSENSHKIKEIT